MLEGATNLAQSTLNSLQGPIKCEMRLLRDAAVASKNGRDVGSLVHRGYASAAAAAAALGSGQRIAAEDAPAGGSAAFAAALPGAQQPGAAQYRPAVTGSVLKRHGRDLTQEAADGRLDPLIGRHDVVQRALQVLLRRTKNNPVLIGDPGVGKTAVAEGIAQLIVSPAAPPGLAGRSLVSLDVGSLVAGTQYRGAFEERLTSLLNEVHMAAGRVVLFIDELHILMDAGRVEGGMNAANLLKPALARGDLHCIGATTIEEYRRHVEQDGAFARRFQPVMVEEPSPEEALSWLRGLRGRYERYHGVTFTDAALDTAVRAAQRYIPDRRLPDSAIDVIDEAAARARLHSVAAARAVAVVAAAEAAAKAADAEAVVRWAAAAAVGSHGQVAGDQVASQAKFGPLPLQMAAVSGSQHAMPGGGFAAGAVAAVGGPAAVWPAGGTGLGAAAVHALSCPHCGTPAEPPEGSARVTCTRCRFTFLAIPQDKLLLGASLFTQQQRQRQHVGTRQPPPAAGWTGPLGPTPSTASTAPPQAAPLSPASHPAPAAFTAGATARQEDAAAAAATAVAAAAAARGALLVDAPDVLAVVAEASGIPAAHLSQSDWQPLAQLESRLRRKVAGQDGAVAAVVGAVRLGRMGLHRRARPLASLLLTGPAGVGKATLCGALAEALFGSDRHLLRFNLAEFSDRASVSRLVGAPPGYVGYGDGGLLTEAVRRRPHSVVLLERVDRAHPEVLSLVTQVLASGRLQDSVGKTCDFRNAIVVLTTSPTNVPLPPAWAQARAAVTADEASVGSGGSGAGTPSGGTATTSVVVPEAHVHPEAYAGDSSGAAQHSGHSAAAQCLVPEEEPRARRQTAAGAVHPLQYLPGELLTQLDAVVGMQPLSRPDVARVVELQLDEVRASLAQEQGIELAVEPAVATWLAARASAGITAGAQRLQAVLREELLLPVAEALLQERVQQQEDGGSGAQANAAHVAVAPDGARLAVTLA